jgi:hypothetical protein
MTRFVYMTDVYARMLCVVTLHRLTCLPALYHAKLQLFVFPRVYNSYPSTYWLSDCWSLRFFSLQLADIPV